MPAKHAGVTLIELVITITILSIVITVVSSMVVNQTRQSVDPMLKVRATELAQSMLNEITGRAFDHNSDFAGGGVRCDDRIPNEPAGPLCTTPLSTCPAGAYFPNAEEIGKNRALFNDVDDYNCLDQTGTEITNALGQPLGNLYVGYRLQVFVSYDGNYDGIADDSSVIANRGAKLIRVVVTPPDNESISFSAYRANY